jgi:carbamoylphosphate synthase small subunit
MCRVRRPNCGLKVKDKPVFSVQYHPGRRQTAGQPLSLPRFVALMEEKGKG